MYVNKETVNLRLNYTNYVSVLSTCEEI